MQNIPGRKIWVFLFLALLTVALRAPSINALFDTDSSANAFFARQMLRGEDLYGKYHPTHHLPGIYYTFLLAFKILGDDPVGVWLLLLLFFIVTVWLIYKLGSLFFDDLTGLLGAFFFILLASQVTLSGMTAEMEHFANLPLTATILLYLILEKKAAPPAHFLWVGVLGAICVLYKIIFLGALAAVGISMLAAIWVEREQPGALAKHSKRIAMLILGFLVPLALTAGYYAGIGLWGRFILIFKLGFGYFENTEFFPGRIVFPKPFGFPLFMLAMNNIALLLFGLMGGYRLIRRAFPLRTAIYMPNIALPLWFIFSLGLAGARGSGFGHYVLVVVPPLALLGGAEISMTLKRWQSENFGRSAYAGIAIMVILVVGCFGWRNYELYQKYVKYLSQQKESRQAYFTYSDDQEQKLKVIEYLKQHSDSGDYIYVWSTNLQEYYYADRLPPIDILWPEYISATGAPERIFSPNTKYIIVDRVKFRPEWLDAGLTELYTMETVMYDRLEIYRRTTP